MLSSFSDSENKHFKDKINEKSIHPQELSWAGNVNFASGSPAEKKRPKLEKGAGVISDYQLTLFKTGKKVSLLSHFEKVSYQINLIEITEIEEHADLLFFKVSMGLLEYGDNPKKIKPVWYQVSSPPSVRREKNKQKQKKGKGRKESSGCELVFQ